MVTLVKAIINFVFNNPIEVLVIGVIAYGIVGVIMRVSRELFGVWFGRRGGRMLWLATALLLSFVYHMFKR